MEPKVCCCQLKRSVIRKGEAAIRLQSWDTRLLQVAFNET